MANLTETATEARWGRWLFWFSAFVLLAACLHDIGAPWENGMRGGTAARYSHVAVAHTLRYGLGVTMGLPAFVSESSGELIVSVNWHHPPGYWLYIALFSWLAEPTPLVMRLAHLTLFLPALPALFLLVRRRSGSVAAGVAALLFAACPMVAHFGPMVLQDGAVLGCGLVTLWSFDRHLAAPSGRRWLATAVLFFVVASWDYSGYWWGPAMFVLALGHERRAWAVGQVLTLFPVSLAAFVVMALHYGLHFGGPMAFVHELINTVGVEAKASDAAVTGERVLAAANDVLFAHGNLAAIGLALLGALSWRGAGSLRRSWLLAVALTLPGVLNYATFLRHGLDHVFWSMHGFAGIAVFGAAVVMRGLPTVRRAGGILVALGVATTIVGVWQTHALIRRCAFTDPHGTVAAVQSALPHLGGCATTLSSCPAVSVVQFDGTSVVFDINTDVGLKWMLEHGKAAGAHGQFGFVVHPKHRGSPLTDLLDTMAPRIVVGEVWVYRLNL